MTKGLPSLNTERFTLTGLTAMDIPEMLAMYQEPDSNKYVVPLQNKTEEEFIALFEKKIHLNSTSDGQGMWVIRNQSGEFMGSCNLNVLSGTDWLQVGCHLVKNQWNKGIAGEVCARIVRYGFEVLNLPEIFGIFEQENVASQKILERLNFTFDRKDTFKGVPVIIYKCIKNL